MTNRTLLQLSCPDARDFLQGLMTNDVTKTDQGLVYGALLTPQGKFIADFFVADMDGTLVLDVATTHAAALFQKLSMYRLRAQVEITESTLIASRGVGHPPKGALPDPRDPALGWRCYGTQDLSDDTDWDALRVAHVIPETGIELTPETYILEAGFERLNGVDFRKGCYVGQEIAARMKHKTELKKGLVQVAIDGSAPVGTEILSDGKPAGTVFTQSGGKAIAFLRFARASEHMTAGDAVVRQT